MTVDHRTCELQPGRLREFLALYEKEGLPVQRKHLGNLIGYYTTEVGNVNEIVRMAGLFTTEPGAHGAHEQQDIDADFLLTHEVRD